MRLPLSLLVTVLAVSSACSGTSSAPSTTGTTTSTTPSTPVPAPCTFALSSTSVSQTPAGGSTTITVTSGTGCTWTATSSAAFITVTSGASGSGNGSVVFSTAQNGGVNRTGTLTIAGQTVTVTQTGANIIVAFDMYDPPSQAGPTSTCRVRGVPGYPITSCTLTNTSRTTGSNSLVNFAWTITYNYDGQAKTQTQNTGSIRDFAFYEFCGLAGSSANGTAIPLNITLTVTDNNGITATARSGEGNQPALTFVAYACS